MKYKTSELTGIELEFTVRTLIGEFEKDAPGATLQDYIDAGGGFGLDWATCGPIIEHERISVVADHGTDWLAAMPEHRLGEWGTWTYSTTGTTALEAAMRAFVVTKIGAEVEL